MAAPGDFYPALGTGAIAGALDHARHIASSPDPLTAVGVLQNWIAEPIGSDDEPQDFGALYAVFASLGDIGSALGQGVDSMESVSRAAEEWLTAYSADRDVSRPLSDRGYVPL